VHSLAAENGSGWQAGPMLQTDRSAWLETGKIGGEVSFDPKSGDIPGPLTIGMTLTRDVEPAAGKSVDAAKAGDKTGDASAAANDAAKSADAANAKSKAAEPIHQRVALVGDADFLDNGTLGAFGNKQLGINLIEWLSSRDAQLNIDIPKAQDASLYISGWGMYAIAIGFLLALPAALLVFGVARWVVRRRA
jgi:hypothetical protein